MCKIAVVDSICGSGKTSAIIDIIKNDNTDNKYIYITPFLTEVERIETSCNNKKFYQPKFNSSGNKFTNLNKLISENKNIVSTHALFQKANLATVDLIKSGEYILILDEAFNVVEQMDLSINDLHILIDQKYAYIENGFLLWNEEYLDYKGIFENIKYLCINRSLMVYKDIVLLWTFPVEVFKAFNKVYILTYMFDAQEQYYYYKMHDIDMEFYYAIKENNRFILKEKDANFSERDIKQKLKSLINIINDEKLNALGDSFYSLSHSWYNNEDNINSIRRLKNNMINFIINKTKSKADNLIWTTFKDYKNQLQGKGYTKGFLSCNMRATNDYANRHNIMYCINIFMNPIVDKFFSDKGVSINKNKYALSELIQFLFRSGIRNNEQINLYIPSSRMRELLEMWLND